MRAVLASIGTDGDIYPYVGLGVELKARGHQVALLASESYKPLATANDFEFHALVSTQENNELFGHPDFWHPVRTVMLSANWGRRFLSRQYELLSNVVTDRSLIVANPGVFAAGLVHETHKCPFVSIVLQPGIVPSSMAPPVFMGLSFLNKAPRSVWRMFWGILDFVGGQVIGKDLNKLRASLGLRPIRRIFRNWLSPQLALGMFPDWYGPPQPDWPPSLRPVGFPLVTGSRSANLPESVLQFLSSGPPPIAITFGTGMRHSAQLFQTAADALLVDGRRGIFLTKHRDQLPASLPESILHCTYAPFDQLLPRCAVVVHHGGIGTVSQAMAAGTPQLILPICFDQEDNGARVKRLAVGSFLSPRQRRPANIARALSDLTAPHVRAQCETIADRLVKHDAIAQAATLIESLAAQHSRL